MKKIIILVILVTLSVFFWNSSKKEKWSGFFYPNADNLSVFTESKNIFYTVDECRKWVNTQLRIYVLDNPGTNINNVNYDYECGLNCKFDSKYGLNICKKTIK